MTAPATLAMSENQAGTGAFPRHALAWASVAYLAFVIYGSLVPLDFHPLPWDEALRRFQAIPYLQLGIGSRADWVANILLFIPLTFLWLGLLWPRRNQALRGAASALIVAACVALSVAIEFTQIYFPPRTVSLNDILAESIGAVAGMSLWWTAGPSMARWYVNWGGSRALDLAQRVLYVYLFLLFGYNLLPLDLTISPMELYHKWHQGRIVLVPFAGDMSQPAQALYGLATDILLWVPAGFLGRLAAGRGTTQVWLRLTATAALLEFLQLFVFTRVTDVTDILTGSLGSAIGAILASRWRVQSDVGKPAPAGWIGVGTLAWLVLIFAVFWYPFDFQADGTFVRDRLGEAATRVPFSAYYFGTEYRAATEVLHKVGFFFPLGLLLGLLVNRARPASRRFWNLAALIIACTVAGIVEAGQLFLPGKFADLTDWMLEVAGAWAGCALAWRLWPAKRVRSAPVAPVRARSPWPFAVALVLGLSALLWGATHVAAVPYNVRELIAPERPLLSALLLACATAWVFGFPAWAAGRAAARPTRLPALLLVHGIGAWILLRLAVPLESLHDIVGSPILGWPWEWEIMGRFLGLFALWSVVSFGAALFALRPWLAGARESLLVWSMLAAVLLPLAYIVVIREAATDNLTELLVGGGTPLAFLWITAGLLALTLAGSHLACALGSGMRVGIGAAVVWSILSFPLAYFALNAGFESFIIKYGKVFSAFQFLLSKDREHYAAPLELAMRYGIAHGALLLLAAASQAPFLGRLVLAHAGPAIAPLPGQHSVQPSGAIPDRPAP